MNGHFSIIPLNNSPFITQFTYNTVHYYGPQSYWVADWAVLYTVEHLHLAVIVIWRYWRYKEITKIGDREIQF